MGDSTVPFLDTCLSSTEEAATSDDEMKEKCGVSLKEVNIQRITMKIRSMSLHDLEYVLQELDEDVWLSKKQMQKHLREICNTSEVARNLLLKRVMKLKCPYKYIFVIDFEATCCDDSKQFYPHEIIEFPAVLIDTDEVKIIDTFHAYVRPVMNPKLTNFCISLTGITQETVDKSNSFEKVLHAYCQWMNKHTKSGESYAILTDGPYDLERFLVLQCIISHIEVPSFGQCWINVKKLFSHSYKVKKTSITNMLKCLGMKFEGKLHSGKDDAYNIARLTLAMLQDGVHIKVNEYIANYRTKQHKRLLASHLRRTNHTTQKVSVIPQNSLGKIASISNEATDDIFSKFEVDPTLVGSEVTLHKHKMRNKSLQ